MIFKTLKEIPSEFKDYAYKMGDEYYVTSISEINKSMARFVGTPAFKALKKPVRKAPGIKSDNITGTS